MPALTTACPPLLTANPSHHAYVLAPANDNTVAPRRDRWMALRSALHRLFGIGKTRADTARNRASWNALLDTIETRAGRAVRHRVYGSALTLPGDSVQGLTIAQRIERGSYLSGRALMAVSALFDDACKVKLANDEAYAQVFQPGKDNIVHPLQTLLDDVLIGFDTLPSGAFGNSTFPLRETRIYAARQLKTGLQHIATDNCLRRDLPALAKALAQTTTALDGLRSPEQRAAWLREYDARLKSLTAPSPDADTERAIAALLSEWRRNELVDCLHVNAEAITQEYDRLSRLAAEDRAFHPDPAAGMHPMVPPPTQDEDGGMPSHETPASCGMVALLAERCSLLAELKGRELADAISRCDQHLAVSADKAQSGRWETRRTKLVAQWQSEDLAEQKERDLLRQDQVGLLQQAVHAEVQQWTAAGKRLDESAMAGIVGELLSRQAFLRPFIVARNLQYLFDVAHGPQRAEEIARLLRACDISKMPKVGGVELDRSDLAWLAAALELGENHNVQLEQETKAGVWTKWASYTRHVWPVSVLCDMAAARLDEYAEERRLALHRWRGCTASLELRWRAGVAALRDIIRNRELKPEDLAPFAFDGLKRVLHARHLAMAQVEEMQRAAQQRMDAVRSLCPALAHWRSETPVGAEEATLFDLASSHITDRLINAHNVRLEGARALLAEMEERRLGGMPVPLVEGRIVPRREVHAPFPEPGEKAMRDMMRIKREIEQGIRQALDGGDGSKGLLVPACDVIEQFARCWPAWNAALLEPGSPGASANMGAELISIKGHAHKALLHLETIRRHHVKDRLDCNGMPVELEQRVQVELRQARDELDNLERTVEAIVESISDDTGKAVMLRPASTLPIPADVVPAIRRGLRKFVRRLL